MTRIVWDAIDDKRYETGIDRGVLYLPSTPGVPWVGLTSIDHAFGQESKAFWRDGVKFLNHQLPSDFSASLKAFTYPEEFEPCNGIQAKSTGLFVHEQPPKPFGLCYRTRIGDSRSGPDHGYNIHLLYNVLASPDNVGYKTLGLDVEPSEFSWTLSSTPQNVGRLSHYRPTAHFTLNSTEIAPEVMSTIEDTLYGTSTSMAKMPTPLELVVILESAERVIILDNGDGTWTAVGPDEYFSHVGGDPTIVMIEEVDAEYLDDDTYEMTVSEL